MQYLLNTTPARSRNMQAIKSADNRSTERRLRARLAQLGIKGWRIRARELPGCPDFVFTTDKVAVFVDGCFWHACPRCGHIPRSNSAYWIAKITRNKLRDRKVSEALRLLGYGVLRIWECKLRTDPERCLQRILKLL
jgi:DNA mismatch endonuclease (patch repair protein)